MILKSYYTASPLFYTLHRYADSASENTEFVNINILSSLGYVVKTVGTVVLILTCQRHHCLLSLLGDQRVSSLLLTQTIKKKKRKMEEIVLANEKRLTIQGDIIYGGK